MPRAHGKGRQTKDIGQRFNRGITSGVTFATIPSGVTIGGTGIDATGLSVTAAVIYASGSLKTSEGFCIASDTNGVEFASGVTRTKGGCSQVFMATGSGAGAYFGLGFTNTITSMTATIGLKSGTSINNCNIDLHGSNTHATVHYFDYSGASYGSWVSVFYFATGT